MANKNFVIPFMGDGTYRVKTQEIVATEPATENTTASKEPTTQPVTGTTAAGTTTQRITVSFGYVPDTGDRSIPIKLSAVIFLLNEVCVVAARKRKTKALTVIIY